VQQNYPPKSPLAVPPRRLGGLVNTGPLSSEESDGALSRSKAPFAVLRPATFPAPPSFPRITIDSDFSRTGFRLSGLAQTRLNRRVD
jgi:hypothetical protein